MNLREVLLTTIRLAQTRNAEDQAIDTELGSDLGYELHSERAVKAFTMPRPAEAALIGHLESLNDDDLSKLRTLMYVGRGDAKDVLAFHVDLARDTVDRDSMIRSMVEKSPLDRYIESGLAVADAAAVDLDDTWPTPAPQSRAEAPCQPSRPLVTPRVFSAGQHPIDDGGAVFKAIANEFMGDTIASPGEVARFFAMLHERTEGFLSRQIRTRPSG